MNNFHPEDFEDPGNGYRRYRNGRREQRRLRRRKRSVVLMLGVMAVALTVSVVHTFSPKRPLEVETPQIDISIITPDFIRKIDSLTAILDSIVGIDSCRYPDEPAEAFLKRMEEKYASTRNESIKH